MKRRKVLIGFLIVLVLVGMWMKRPRTVYEIVEKEIALEDEIMPAQLCTIMNMPWEEGETLRRAEIEDKGDFEKVISVLKGTEVSRSSFRMRDTITYKKGTDCYDLRFYLSEWYPASKEITFLTDGKVYYGNWVYEIKGDDPEKVTDLLEELLQGYERATKEVQV